MHTFKLSHLITPFTNVTGTAVQNVHFTHDPKYVQLKQPGGARTCVDNDEGTRLLVLCSIKMPANAYRKYRNRLTNVQTLLRREPHVITLTDSVIGQRVRTAFSHIECHSVFSLQHAS